MPILSKMSTDVARLAAPLAAAIGLVGILCYFWPKPAKFLLDKKRKTVKVIEVVQLTHDVKRFRFSTGHKSTKLGLPIGKHLSLFAPNPKKSMETGKWNGKDDKECGDLEIKRSYTPTPRDNGGYLELVVKIYRPGTFKLPNGQEMTWADGGKMSLHLDSLRVGDSIDIDGPTGHIEYLGNGTFKVPGQARRTSTHVGMMAGGTGITPMLQVVAAALDDPEDKTQFSLIYANKTQDDILVKDILEDYVQRGEGRFKLFFTLDLPPADWKGLTGFITADMIKAYLPPPSPDTSIFMCGPPPMIEFACKRNLEALGYDKSSYHAF